MERAWEVNRDDFQEEENLTPKEDKTKEEIVLSDSKIRKMDVVLLELSKRLEKAKRMEKVLTRYDISIIQILTLRTLKALLTYKFQ